MPPPNNNVNQIDDTGGPQAWFNSLPLITRYWFGLAFLTTCAANFGIVSPLKLIYLWDNIYENFEIWRFVSPFLFIGKFDFNTLMALYMLVSFSQRYEMEPYNTGAGGGTADYAAALMFGAASIFATYPLVGMVMKVPPIFGRTLTFFVIYTWSKRHPAAPASIWGIQMKAIHLPFAYLGLSVLMGNMYSDLLHGIAVGHLFYFLVDVVPIVYGKDVIHTPQFLIDRLGVGAYVPPADVAGGRGGGAVGNNVWRPPGRTNPPRDPAGSSRGYHWGGGGRTLGSS
mmetsp:Transcript_12819/g.26997  ORF Transcript_12819/g.26997 Transcript_12819/m.26997 type:complete len:284 (-) Transcript_12819:452-1303(-)